MRILEERSKLKKKLKELEREKLESERKEREPEERESEKSVCAFMREKKLKSVYFDILNTCTLEMYRNLAICPPPLDVTLPLMGWEGESE